MRRICQFVIAVALVFGMCPIAHADEAEGSPTKPLDASESAASEEEAETNQSILPDREAISLKSENTLTALSVLNEGSDYESGRLLVTFKEEVSESSAKAELGSLGMTRVETVFWPSGIQALGSLC